MQTSCFIDASLKSFPCETIFNLPAVRWSEIDETYDRRLIDTFHGRDFKVADFKDFDLFYPQVKVFQYRGMFEKPQCLAMVPVRVIIKYAFLYWQLLFLSDFKRRRVQTSSLVNESTVKHKYTVDVDYQKIVSAQNYINLSGKVFLPVLKGLEMRPLLSVDCDDENGNAMLLSRARENRAVQSLALLGLFLNEYLSSIPKGSQPNLSWVRPLLLKLFRLTYTQNLPEDPIKWLREKTEVGTICKSFVEQMRSSKKFEDRLKYCIETFPLTVVVDPTLKSTGLIKLTVIDELNKKPLIQRLPTRLKDWFLLNTAPKSISVSLAEFGRHSSACHARVIAPEGLIIKDVSLQCFPANELRFARRADSQRRMDDPTLMWQNYKYCQDTTTRAHVLFNEEQAEIHDVSLNEVTFEDDGTPSRYEWNVVVDLIPSYGITHIPAIVLFMVTTVTFCLQAFIEVSSIVSILLNFAIASVSFASTPRAFSWMFRRDRVAISVFAVISLLGSFAVDAWKKCCPTGVPWLPAEGPAHIFAFLFSVVCIFLFVRIYDFKRPSEIENLAQSQPVSNVSDQYREAAANILTDRIVLLLGVIGYTWLMFHRIFFM